MPGGTHDNAKKWTPQEDLVIREYVEEHGNQWTTLAAELPGRTVAMVRNRYLRISTDQVGTNRCKTCGQIARGHTCLLKLPEAMRTKAAPKTIPKGTKKAAAAAGAKASAPARAAAPTSTKATARVGAKATKAGPSAAAPARPLGPQRQNTSETSLYGKVADLVSNPRSEMSSEMSDLVQGLQQSDPDAIDEVAIQRFLSHPEFTELPCVPPALVRMASGDANAEPPKLTRKLSRTISDFARSLDGVDGVAPVPPVPRFDAAPPAVSRGSSAASLAPDPPAPLRMMPQRQASEFTQFLMMPEVDEPAAAPSAAAPKARPPKRKAAEPPPEDTAAARVSRSGRKVVRS